MTERNAHRRPSRPLCRQADGRFARPAIVERPCRPSRRPGEPEIDEIVLTMTRSEVLLDRIRRAFAESDISDPDFVVVTDDANEVSAASDLLSGAVVVGCMPALDWPTAEMTLVTWDISVCGSSSGRVIELLAVLGSAGIGGAAKPTSFTIDVARVGARFPGYTIAHTEEQCS